MSKFEITSIPSDRKGITPIHLGILLKHGLREKFLLQFEKSLPCRAIKEEGLYSITQVLAAVFFGRVQ